MANSKRIPPDPEKKARSRIGIFSIIMVLFVTLLMLLEAMAGVAPAQTNNPATASANIQPNPIMNTNITWSSFHSGWNPLEYSNGTGNQTLNAEMNPSYANPITVNPADIQSQALTNHSWAGQNWLNTANWTAPSLYGSVTTITNPVSNEIELTTNGSKAGAVSELITGQSALISQLPTSNTAYLYETITGYSTTSTPMTGTSMAIWTSETASPYMIALNGTQLVNNSKAGTLGSPTIQAGEPFMVSFPLSDFSKSINAFSSAQLDVGITIPTQTVSDNYLHIFITGESITTHIMSLGTTANGTQVVGSFNDIQLAHLNPTFSYSAITDNGYSVAVSQTLQNLTTQQSAISSGSYVEQVEYQGSFALPTAPDLSYGGANLIETFNLSTSQTQVLDINGVSYLSMISGKNGTIQLLSSVNPNGQTQFLQIVDYTQSQWTSISNPPGIFTIQGIEYYWEEFIIAILAVVGIGAGAASKHASSLRKVK